MKMFILGGNKPGNGNATGIGFSPFTLPQKCLKIRMRKLLTRVKRVKATLAEPDDAERTLNLDSCFFLSMVHKPGINM